MQPNILPIEPFDPKAVYRANDPALRVVATEATLRTWRCRGKGPRWYRYGNRVLYRGVDLNEHLAANMTPGALEPVAA